MAYKLNEVTIRTNNTKEGIGKIGELWHDIMSGKLPIVFDSDHNLLQEICPVSKYSNYETNENGDYDLSILGVTAEFYQHMDKKVSDGNYKKYDVSDESGDVTQCTKKHGKKYGRNKKMERFSGHLPRIMRAVYRRNLQKMEKHTAIFTLL